MKGLGHQLQQCCLSVVESSRVFVKEARKLRACYVVEYGMNLRSQWTNLGITFGAKLVTQLKNGKNILAKSRMGTFSLIIEQQIRRSCSAR